MFWLYTFFRPSSSFHVNSGCSIVITRQTKRYIKQKGVCSLQPAAGVSPGSLSLPPPPSSFSAAARPHAPPQHGPALVVESPDGGVEPRRGAEANAVAGWRLGWRDGGMEGWRAGTLEPDQLILIKKPLFWLVCTRTRTVPGTQKYWVMLLYRGRKRKERGKNDCDFRGFQRNDK